MTPTSELAIRAGALYLPVCALAVAVLLRRPVRSAERSPDRRAVGAALIATAWNLAGLYLLNLIAPAAGWWRFTVESGILSGIPADLWVGWAVLWGAVPVLAAPRRPMLTGGLLVAVDLVLMPLGAPVVELSPTWLVGEAVAVATVLTPGLLLGRWTIEGRRVAIRAGLQIVAFATLMFAVIPAAGFTITGDDFSVLAHRSRLDWAAFVVIIAAPGAMGLQAVMEFALVGGGTPVPLDPPTRLVATGPYAYVANPMQLGGTLILAAWGGFLASPVVAAAAVIAAAFSAGFAGWHEQAELIERFGDDWTAYRRQVRVWLPRWRPRPIDGAWVAAGTTCEPCAAVGEFLRDRRGVGLTVTAAENSPVALERITYRAPGIAETGLAAIGRSLEHAHLGWALVSWIVRLPGVVHLLQLIADAVGAGPRPLGGSATGPEPVGGGGVGSTG